MYFKNCAFDLWPVAFIIISVSIFAKYKFVANERLQMCEVTSSYFGKTPNSFLLVSLFILPPLVSSFIPTTSQTSLILRLNFCSEISLGNSPFLLLSIF